MATMSDASAADSPADTATELARERTSMAGERTSMAGDRTLWAADRTLMAWIRTSLALIGFGFAVGQGVEFIATAREGTATYESARFFGLSFISLGVVALAGAVVQHLRIEKTAAKERLRSRRAVANRTHHCGPAACHWRRRLRHGRAMSLENIRTAPRIHVCDRATVAWRRRLTVN